MNSLPALLGGPPASPLGPPAWPPADPAVEAALVQAARDGSWGQYQGRHAALLEERLARLFAVPHVMTCGSGTYAVELALRALEAAPGDEVVLAAYEYPGTFLTLHALGCRPVLVDLAADSWCLDVDRLEEALGPRTKAVIVSHLHGSLVPMSRVMEIAARRGVRVLEDAAQAPGATVQGKPAGSWGHVGVLSFGGSKLLSAGRGGALLTHDPRLFQRARRHQLRGNVVCPLAELQATVLLPQLDRLLTRTQRRHSAVLYLRERLAGLAGVRLFGSWLEDSQPAYYKLGLQLEPDRFGLSRSLLAAAARAEGVALDEGFSALHRGRSPSRFQQAGPLPRAEHADVGALVLHHPVLLESDDRLEEVALALEKIQAHARDIVARFA